MWLSRSLRRRPLHAVVCGVMFALAIAGCGSSGSSSSAGASKVQLKMTLISFNADTTFKSIIADFEKANPNINVNFTGLTEAQYMTTVRTQLGAESGPDIFFAAGGSGNPMAVDDLVKAGLIQDMSSQPWASRLVPLAKAEAGPDGKVYAWPEGLVAIDAMYSPKLFAAKGLTVPKTWSSVLSYCRAAKAKGLIPFAFPAQDQTSAQMYTLALVASTVYGPTPGYNAEVENGSQKLTSSTGWQAALAKVLDMQHAGCFNSSPTGTTFPSALGMFASGQAGAMVWINSLAGSIEGQAHGLQLASFGLPASDTPGANYMSVLAGGGFAVNAHSSNQAAADKFLEYLSQPAIAKEFFQDGDALSSLTNVSVTPSANQAPVAAALQAGRAAVAPSWNNDQTQNVMIAGIQSMLAGQGSASSVLSQMQSTIQAAR